MKSRSIIAGIQVFLLLLLVSPLASAQQTYTQPMFTVNWGSSRSITVSIPSQPEWAYNIMLRAMEEWNQAQQWFVQSYYPYDRSSVFTLTPATNPNGMVKVTWTQGSAEQCGSSSVEGCTLYGGGVIVITVNKLDTNLAAHELGHVLGLSDNAALPNDLMHMQVPSADPSTLDLYAVFVVVQSGGSAQSGDSVTLPSSIPYEYWAFGMSPIPEFPDLFPVLATVLLLVGIGTNRRFKRNHFSARSNQPKSNRRRHQPSR